MHYYFKRHSIVNMILDIFLVNIFDWLNNQYLGE